MLMTYLMSYVLYLIHLMYFYLMLGRVMLTCDSFALVGWTSTPKGGFSEGQYNDHVSKLDVGPYLSGMMLGYSKILMVENFKEIVRLGDKPIYSDTDSIVFVMSEAQCPQYQAKFIPPKKTFGGMEIEGIYERLITIGPKKYAVLAHTKRRFKEKTGDSQR